MEELVPLNLKEMSLKCKSKKELYDVLASDCDIYLPPIEYANAAYIRNILCGKTKFFKASSTKLIQVAQIESLSVKEIMKFAQTKFGLEDYLPKYTTFRFPSMMADYYVLLVNTIIEGDFKKWIQSKMRQREKKLVMKRKFNVRILPEIADAIKSSNRVSTMTGRSHYLLRPPTHKRVKLEEYKEIILSNEQLDLEKSELILEIDDLKQKLNEFKMQSLEDIKYREDMEELIRERSDRQREDERITF